MTSKSLNFIKIRYFRSFQFRNYFLELRFLWMSKNIFIFIFLFCFRILFQNLFLRFNLISLSPWTNSLSFLFNYWEHIYKVKTLEDFVFLVLVSIVLWNLIYSISSESSRYFEHLQICLWWICQSPISLCIAKAGFWLSTA